MADTNLVLNVNQRVTMNATGHVSRVAVPKGTRTVLINSPSPFYWETPATVKADNDAETAAKQFRFEAGTYSLGVSGDGGKATPTALKTLTYFYFVATVASQEISFRASPLTGM
jgi:hypothetical protein